MGGAPDNDSRWPEGVSGVALELLNQQNQFQEDLIHEEPRRFRFHAAHCSSDASDLLG